MALDERPHTQSCSYVFWSSNPIVPSIQYQQHRHLCHRASTVPARACHTPHHSLWIFSFATLLQHTKSYFRRKGGHFERFIYSVYPTGARLLSIQVSANSEMPRIWLRMRKRCSRMAWVRRRLRLHLTWTWVYTAWAPSGYGPRTVGEGGGRCQLALRRGICVYGI